MRWRLLQRITQFIPGRQAVAIASTDFPAELFADHFPSFPVTPGVLLLEMAAQLGGRLVEATGSELAGTMVFPVLTMVMEAKFRGFVPPASRVVVTADLEHMRQESAICKAAVEFDGYRCASMRLMFAFDPTGKLENGDRNTLEAFEREEFLRLGLKGFPPGPVTVDPDCPASA